MTTTEKGKSRYKKRRKVGLQPSRELNGQNKGKTNSPTMGWEGGGRVDGDTGLEKDLSSEAILGERD